MAASLPAVPLALAMVVGCGDSLLGEVGLGQPLGLDPAPAAVQWEFRWFDGDALTAPCPRYEPVEEPVFGEGLAAGYLDSPSPDLDTVATGATVDAKGADYTWSLGLGLLVEGGPERTATSTDPMDGVLGVAPFTALLAVDGDVDAFLFDLDVIVYEDDVVAQSGGGLALQWIDFDAYQVASTGSFVSSMFVVGEPGASFAGTEAYIPVDSLAIVDPLIEPLWRGEPLDGVAFPGCG